MCYSLDGFEKAELRPGPSVLGKSALDGGVVVAPPRGEESSYASTDAQSGGKGEMGAGAGAHS